MFAKVKLDQFFGPCCKVLSKWSNIDIDRIDFWITSTAGLSKIDFSVSLVIEFFKSFSRWKIVLQRRKKRFLPTKKNYSNLFDGTAVQREMQTLGADQAFLTTGRHRSGSLIVGMKRETLVQNDEISQALCLRHQTEITRYYLTSNSIIRTAALQILAK